MGNNNNTRNHNLELLRQLSFKKYLNTTVFYKNDLCIISPAVAENQSGGYWFDLRRVNIERLSSVAYLFVRIVPDLFILESVGQISSLISPSLMDNRPHSGDVWGIGLEFTKSNMTAQLFNKSASHKKIQSKLLSLSDAKIALSELC